jgi:acetoin utilization protein AcuA
LTREPPIDPALVPAEHIIQVETHEGSILIVPKCPPQLIGQLQLDAGLGHFSHYSSIIQKLDVFEKIASSRDGTVALALVHGKIIVGYATGSYPESTERWSKLGDLMYELATIEVSRNYRGMDLSNALVGSVMQDDWHEDKITYMNGFSWHWDLDGNHVTMAQYRKLMLNLMKNHGFQEYYTNEPNIAIREENIFMARIGSRVSVEDQHRFRNLRFGIVSK